MFFAKPFPNFCENMGEGTLRKAKEVLTVDDKCIVDLYWDRSERAIEETDIKYGRYCYSVAYNILNNKEDSEESVNDTYLDAWNSMPPHRPSVLSTFLAKITRRISIDKYRRKTAKKRGDGEVPLALEELDECIGSSEDLQSEINREDLIRLLNTFLRSLPITERKVFVCRYWYLDSVSSVAEQFGFSEAKVKSMLHRTREKLRQRLIEEGFNEGL